MPVIQKTSVAFLATFSSLISHSNVGEGNIWIISVSQHRCMNMGIFFRFLCSHDCLWVVWFAATFTCFKFVGLCVSGTRKMGQKHNVLTMFPFYLIPSRGRWAKLGHHFLVLLAEKNINVRAFLRHYHDSFVCCDHRHSGSFSAEHLQMP